MSKANRASAMIDRVNWAETSIRRPVLVIAIMAISAAAAISQSTAQQPAPKAAPKPAPAPAAAPKAAQPKAPAPAAQQQAAAQGQPQISFSPWTKICPKPADPNAKKL